MSTVDLPADVGWTSLMTSYARAQETKHSDRLIEDPFAEHHLGRVA